MDIKKFNRFNRLMDDIDSALLGFSSDTNKINQLERAKNDLKRIVDQEFSSHNKEICSLRDELDRVPFFNTQSVLKTQLSGVMYVDTPRIRDVVRERMNNWQQMREFRELVVKPVIRRETESFSFALEKYNGLCIGGDGRAYVRIIIKVKKKKFKELSNNRDVVNLMRKIRKELVRELEVRR